MPTGHDPTQSAIQHKARAKELREYLDEKTAFWAKTHACLGDDFKRAASIAQKLELWAERLDIAKRQGARKELQFEIEAGTGKVLEIEADYLSAERVKKAGSKLRSVLRCLESLENLSDGHVPFREQTEARFLKSIDDLDGLDILAIDLPRAYQAWQNGEELSFDEFTGLSSGED